MRNNRWINFVPYLIVILALFSLMNMNTGTVQTKQSVTPLIPIGWIL